MKNIKLKKNDIEICFGNELDPVLWRKFQEEVISENLKEHIPYHLQEQLLDELVNAGFIKN